MHTNPLSCYFIQILPDLDDNAKEHSYYYFRKLCKTIDYKSKS